MKIAPRAGRSASERIVRPFIRWQNGRRKTNPRAARCPTIANLRARSMTNFPVSMVASGDDHTGPDGGTRPQTFVAARNALISTAGARSGHGAVRGKVVSVTLRCGAPCAPTCWLRLNDAFATIPCKVRFRLVGCLLPERIGPADRTTYRTGIGKFRAGDHP
jgi:hypothetical protein